MRPKHSSTAISRLARPLIGLLAIVGMVLPSLAYAEDPTVAINEDMTLGAILTTPDGWTLYRWDRDEPGVSNCYDACEQLWLPFVVSAEPVAPMGLAGALGVAVRRDGAMQLTYEGSPLYRNSADTQPGTTNGQGVGNLWWVISVGAAPMMEMMEPEPMMDEMMGEPTVLVREKAGLGSYLADPQGMTLYRFGEDPPGESVCYQEDDCATYWPPYVIEGDPVAPMDLAGELVVHVRRDGQQQVVYNGRPLYYYVVDRQPGDAFGQRITDTWGFWRAIDLSRD